MSTDPSATTGPPSTDGTTPSSTDAPTATTIEPETTDASDETSGVTSDTGECPPGTFPPPPVPAEWSGPFVLSGGGEPQPCPAGLMPAEVDVVHRNPSGTCSCTCGLDCNFEMFEAGNGCGNLSIGTLPITLGGSCFAAQDVLLRLTGDSVPTTCASPSLGPPQIVWGATHQVCAGLQQECVPVPPDAFGPCIRAEGVLGCPDEFERRIVAGTTLMEPVCDQCSECVAEANEACADASLAIHSDGGCLMANGSVPAGMCTPDEDISIELDATPPMCPPSPVDAELADPVTFCCIRGP